MRVDVEIAGQRRRHSEADAQWVHEQIDRRCRDGRPPCVRVYVESDGVNLMLSTAGCQTSGGSRRARPEEQPILELWRKRHLDQPEFTGDDVVAFLRQLAL